MPSGERNRVQLLVGVIIMFTTRAAIQHHPPSPILKPSIVMTAPSRCSLPRFPVPPAASHRRLRPADEVPPRRPSEVGTISQHDANIRILHDLPAILVLARRGVGPGGNGQRTIQDQKRTVRASKNSQYNMSEMLCLPSSSRFLFIRLSLASAWWIPRIPFIE